MSISMDAGVPIWSSFSNRIGRVLTGIFMQPSSLFAICNPEIAARFLRSQSSLRIADMQASKQLRELIPKDRQRYLLTVGLAFEQCLGKTGGLLEADFWRHRRL